MSTAGVDRRGVVEPLRDAAGAKCDSDDDSRDATDDLRDGPPDEASSTDESTEDPRSLADTLVESMREPTIALFSARARAAAMLDGR